MHKLHRVCFVVEKYSDVSSDILSDMFYELTDRYGFGLQTLIPDIETNQIVFDIFNEPIKRLHVSNLVGKLGKRSMIKGKPNLRSQFVDLKVQSSVVEVIGKYKSPNAEFYRAGRTRTVENRSEMAYYMVELCHTFVGLWGNGKAMRPLTQYANSLGRRVVLVDI